MRRLIVASLAAGLVGGCPDGDDDTVPIDQAAERVGLVLCDRVQECSALGLTLLAQTTCDQIAWSYRNDTLGALATWVGAGQVVYDEAAMAVCLADLDAAACAALSTGVLTDVGRCGEAIAGQIATGGACDDDLQCRAGAWCDVTATCPGTCQPRVASGMACATNAACGPGLDCAADTCQALGQAGASCGSGRPECAWGLQCDTAAGTPGVCQPLTFTAAAGASCRPAGGVLCQPGLVCALIANDPATYQCEAPVAASAPCHRAIPSACPAGTVCVVASGTVGACQPQGQAGQPCLTGSGVLFGCAAGTTCDFDTDTCVTLVDNGAACVVDAQCANACAGGVCGGPVACD